MVMNIEGCRCVVVMRGEGCVGCVGGKGEKGDAVVQRLLNCQQV